MIVTGKKHHTRQQQLVLLLLAYAGGPVSLECLGDVMRLMVTSHGSIENAVDFVEVALATGSQKVIGE